MARSNTERRLEALEDAVEARVGLVVCLRDCGTLRDASETERAAWLEGYPRVIGGVLVTHILDDVEEAGSDRVSPAPRPVLSNARL